MWRGQLRVSLIPTMAQAAIRHIEEWRRTCDASVQADLDALLQRATATGNKELVAQVNARAATLRLWNTRVRRTLTKMPLPGIGQNQQP